MDDRCPRTTAVTTAHGTRAVDAMEEDDESACEGAAVREDDGAKARKGRREHRWERAQRAQTEQHMAHSRSLRGRCIHNEWLLTTQAERDPTQTWPAVAGRVGW